MRINPLLLASPLSLMNFESALNNSDNEVTSSGQPYTPQLDHAREYTLPSSRVRNGPTRLIPRPDPVILRQSKLRWLELRLNQKDVQSDPQLWNIYAHQLQKVLGPELGKTEVISVKKIPGTDHSQQSK
jgi:hypothetical protein